MNKLSRIILVKCQAIWMVKEVGEVKEEGIRGMNSLSWPPRGGVKVLFFACIFDTRQGGDSPPIEGPGRGSGP